MMLRLAAVSCIRAPIARAATAASALASLMAATVACHVDPLGA
ncbi:hypothetical protein [Mycolicibacterium aichiense]|nr:hypothetical protein [Mycolicibacterium aichiense]